MISSAAHPRWLCRFSDERLGRLVQFFGGSLGVTAGGRFVSMISCTTHPRSPLTATILDLVSIDFLTNACVDWSDFLVPHWG
jgi:hypothetical protein